MRLIGHLASEKQAFALYSFLLSQGIHSTYEKKGDEPVSIWVYEEDQVEAATTYLQEFTQNPADPKFAKVAFPAAPPQPPDTIAKIREKQEEPKKVPRARKIRTYPVTYFVLFVCILFFSLNSLEKAKKVETEGRLASVLGTTPVERVLLFEYSAERQKLNELLSQGTFKAYNSPQQVPRRLVQEAENVPSWRGILALLLRAAHKTPANQPVDGPMFVQIKEGQVWRLLTPIFLHANFVHILFNMLWAWLLLRQIEERLPRFKLLLMIVIIGVISNVSQYLVSGSFFVGFSGVLMGLVGFIWSRQKLAPWEGYPLNRTTFTFIFIYIGAMLALEIVSLLTSLLFAKEFSAHIANTAHVVGGVVGFFLGRNSFFVRGPK